MRGGGGGEEEWGFKLGRSDRRGQGGPRGAQPPHFFGWMKTNLLFINTPSRFMSGVLDSVLGPPCLARHTWRCPCISVVQKQRTRRVKGPRRAPCQLKKPFEGPRQGSCWEERKRIVFPRWGVIDLPSRQIDEFLQKGNRKNCVSDQTWSRVARTLAPISTTTALTTLKFLSNLTAFKTSKMSSIASGVFKSYSLCWKPLLLRYQNIFFPLSFWYAATVISFPELDELNQENLNCTRSSETCLFSGFGQRKRHHRWWHGQILPDPQESRCQYQHIARWMGGQ